MNPPGRKPTYEELEKENFRLNALVIKLMAENKELKEQLEAQ